MGFFRSIFDAEYGLVQANLKAYSLSRTSGLSHSDALGNMVRTRYRLGGEKLRRVTEKLDEVLRAPDADPTWQLRSIIVEMYDAEVPDQHSNFTKLTQALDEGVEEWSNRYPHIL